MSEPKPKAGTIPILLCRRGKRHACMVGAEKYGSTLCGRDVGRAIIDNGFPTCLRCASAIRKVLK